MAYYYLNKITNSYNQYKYQYLDHMETTIDIKQNYWQFNTQLFCINDYKLPPGSLVANLDIPYQEINDISFYLASDQSRAQTAVTYNKKYSHIYESKFNVDVSGNQYLKQDINNTRLNCSIRLEMDPQVIKTAGTTFDQEALDTLISETTEQRWDFSLYYTNTHLVSTNTKINNIFGYQLDSGQSCTTKFSTVDVSCNQYSDINQSISHLSRFASSIEFQIVYAKVKFHYWLEEESEEKTLEYIVQVSHRPTKQIDVDLGINTSYDFTNNKVIIDSGGISGFYIPKYSHGYYELELQLNQNNNINKFIIKNNFNFINSINQPHIAISKMTITNLDNFERIIYND